MNLRLLSDVLLWCTVLNYAILLVWFVVFALGRDWLSGLLGRWFHLSGPQFDALHYGGMTVYKVGILLLNLVPYIVLRVAVGHSS